jgi:hypothetical protein
MDEILDLLIRFMEEVGQNFDSLSEEEANEISEFLIETFSILQKPAPAPKVSSALPVGADLLWYLSGEEPETFTRYLQTYPGEGFQELANNPTQLASVIQRLQQAYPGIEPGQDNQGLNYTQFPSSNVEAMKYDPQTGKLLVKFHGENGGPIYQYQGVPAQIFKLLEYGDAFAKTKGKNKWGEWWPMKNPSIGAALNQFIKKGGYPYQRLS